MLRCNMPGPGHVSKHSLGRMRSVLIVSVLTMCVLTGWAEIVSIEIVSVLIISSRIVSMRRGGGVAPGRALAKGKRVRRTRRQIFFA